MKLGVKLPLTIGTLLLSMALVALLGFFQLNNALDTFGNEVATSWQREREVNAMNLAFREQVQEWKNVLLRGKNPEKLARYWAAFEKKERDVATIAQKLQAALPASPAREAVAQFAAKHAAMGQA
jgi:methyl-accepting chemotaxis protein-1 (serine sensor receptor)